MNMQDDNSRKALKQAAQKIGELKERTDKLKQEIKDIKKDLNQNI